MHTNINSITFIKKLMKLNDNIQSTITSFRNMELGQLLSKSIMFSHSAAPFRPTFPTDAD